MSLIKQLRCSRSIMIWLCVIRSLVYYLYTSLLIPVTKSNGLGYIRDIGREMENFVVNSVRTLLKRPAVSLLCSTVLSSGAPLSSPRRRGSRQKDPLILYLDPRLRGDDNGGGGDDNRARGMTKKNAGMTRWSSRMTSAMEILA